MNCGFACAQGGGGGGAVGPLPFPCGREGERAKQRERERERDVSLDATLVQEAFEDVAPTEPDLDQDFGDLALGRPGLGRVVGQVFGF